MKDKVECPQCKKVHYKTELKRNCSNCFACTGCEVYICSSCKGRIVVKEPRPYKRKT